MKDKDWQKRVHGSGSNPMSDAAMRYFGAGDCSQTKVLKHVLSLIPAKSVVDFGTGTGSWLAAALEHGVNDIQGFDIETPPPSELKIPTKNFTATNLGLPIDLGRTYDLAISAEVAEHLHPSQANTFIDNIAASSDLVLFSAALPYQGGVGHRNEFWAEYWAKLFRARGFSCFDILRPLFWHDGSIRSYYRQSLLLFARGVMESTLQNQGFSRTDRPLSLVHPEQYLKIVGRGLPPDLRNIGSDVTQYYDCVTQSPEDVDASDTRRHYGEEKIGWDAVMKHFGV